MKGARISSLAIACSCPPMVLIAPQKSLPIAGGSHCENFCSLPEGENYGLTDGAFFHIIIELSWSIKGKSNDE